MSFTRFHDDPFRIQKQLQQSTDPGRYMVNVPGNGTKPCFMLDPYMRMQKWGGNLMTDSVNLESKLMGIDRKLDFDCTKYDDKPVRSKRIVYPECVPFTEQPRATHPAWTARDLPQDHSYILPLNPQENTCFTFHNNLSTRILEKDNFVPKAPKPELIR
jgi:hypothetical protein